MKCNRYLKQNFPLKPLLQGELILSRCSLPYELPFPDTEVSKSVFIAQNQPLRCLGAGTPCRSQPLTPFIDRLGIGLVSLRHAEMALEYLWGGSPCRRPARSPLRHDGMPLEYLWAWSPCRRPVGSSSSPREDAPEASVGKVSVPKTSQKSPFATRGCLWIICRPTLRADGYAEHPIRTSMSIKQPDSMDAHPFRTSISMKTANFMDTHAFRTSMSMKTANFMDAHTIRTSTDR